MSDLYEALEVRITCGGSAVRVHVTGELDLAAVPTLRSALAGASEATNGDVEVDLSATTFCDAIGLDALLTARHDLRDVGRTLRLIDPAPAVMRLLELTATSEVFDVQSESD